MHSECDGLLYACRLIKHTKQLLEENEERLCIKVLQTLREMMTKDRGYGEKVGKSAETYGHNIHRVDSVCGDRCCIYVHICKYIDTVHTVYLKHS